MSTNAITEAYYDANNADDVESVAIDLYHAAVAAGTESASPSTVNKDTYRTKAIELMTATGVKKPEVPGKFKCFVLKGSTPPSIQNPVYEPAYYADYPALTEEHI